MILNTLIETGKGTVLASPRIRVLDKEEAEINVGDKICKGALIGTLGQTGAWASFKHLHWGLYVHGVPVDPMQWTDPEF